MSPEFTEAFIKKCSDADKRFLYAPGCILDEIIFCLEESRIWALEDFDALGYYEFEVDWDPVDIGPCSFYIRSVSIDKKDIANWDDYYAWRITMEKLND